MEQHPITFEEYLIWEELSFLWARAFDTKDWNLLRSILDSKFTLDYTEVFGYKDENLTPDAYVAIVSSPDQLGPSNIRTQHLLVASKLQKTSATTGIAWRQIRAEHIKYDRQSKEEIAQSTGHGVLEFRYVKVDVEWKISGLKAFNDFFDRDIRGVFPSFPEIELRV